MHTATILYIVDTETDDDTIRNAAERVKEGQGYLRVMLYGPVPIMPISASGSVTLTSGAVGDHWPAEVARVQAEMHERTESIKAILADVDAPGEVMTVFSVLAELKSNLAACTRSADVLVIAENIRKTPDVFAECVHAGLFGTPLGILLNAKVFQPAGHVFLAWDDGDAASSAVHKALPVLKEARKITIGCFDPVLSEDGAFANPGADIGAWLTRHGCSVTLAHYPSGGVELGTSILAKAAELGCDLIVMGAYGHSRMRQALFGGTTRTVLKQSDQAVFLAH